MGVRAPLWISYGILPVTALGIRLVAVGHLAVAGRLAIAREQAANRFQPGPRDQGQDVRQLARVRSSSTKASTPLVVAQTTAMDDFRKSRTLGAQDATGVAKVVPSERVVGVSRDARSSGVRRSARVGDDGVRRRCPFPQGRCAGSAMVTGCDLSSCSSGVPRVRNLTRRGICTYRHEQCP
jgi:hypothetical protein